MADEIVWDDVAWDDAKPKQEIPNAGKNPGGLGTMIRSWGHEIPGAEPLAAAGDYVQNLVMGTPQTWEGTLAARQRWGAEAAKANPVGAVGGAVLSALRVPWMKGTGPSPTLARAFQQYLLTDATRIGQGAGLDAEGRDLASEDAQAAAAQGFALDVVLQLPGAVSAAKRGLKNWSADRAWRALSATPSDEIAITEAMDPHKISGRNVAGGFLRDLKTNDGQFVMQGSPTDVYGRLLRYLEEEGTRKAESVALAEGRGAQVDTKAVMTELEGLLRELDAPEIRTVYPEVGAAVDDFLVRLRGNYADKPVRLATVLDPATGRQVPMASRPGSGATSGEIPAGFREPSNPQSQLLPPEQTTKVPIYEGASAPGSPSTGASPAMMAEAEEGSALAAPEIVASYERTGPAPFPETYAGERLPLSPRGRSQATTRPEPGSGWSPVLLPEERRSLTEWEALKSELMRFVETTKSGRNRPDAAITRDPVLDALGGFSSKIRAADETAAAKVLSPTEMEEFLRSKKAYGTAAEVTPVMERAKAISNTEPPGSAAFEARREARRLPWLVGGMTGAGGGIVGGAAGDPAAAGAGMLLAGSAGYGAQRLAQAVEAANPTMSRVYNSMSEALPNMSPKQIPNELGQPTLTALLAYLRSQETAR